MTGPGLPYMIGLEAGLAASSAALAALFATPGILVFTVPVAVLLAYDVWRYLRGAR